MLDEALAAYRNGDMGIDTAAGPYSEPKATLKRRTDGANINGIKLSV